MIWQNAWAFAGILFLALPVLIHLLSRKRAVLQKFPSLRFLDVTRLLPTRSPNLSDIPLLLVRLGVLAAAVVALAQPLFVSAARKQSINSTLSRVILVDTSASVLRASGGADSVRIIPERLAGDASSSVVLRSANIAGLIRGAEAWLAMQPGRGELVLVSDFQSNVIDSATMAAVPSHVGLKFVQLPTARGLIAEPWRTVNTSVTANSYRGRTSAEWTEYNEHDPGITVVQLFAFISDLNLVLAARDAVRRTFSPGIADSLRPAGIVFRGAKEEATFVRTAKAPGASWMANAMLTVRSNELLQSSASSENVTDTTIAAPFTVLARNNHGAAVVYAAQTESNGAKQLLFFNRGDPSGIVSAALIAAVSNGVAQPSTVAESDTSRLSDESLRKLERAPGQVEAQGSSRERQASVNSGLSDGRWFWLIALILLGVEAWMRRGVASRDPVPERA